MTPSDQPKINIGEAVFVITACVFFDILDILLFALGLIPVVGQVFQMAVIPIFKFFVWGGLQSWLFFKGSGWQSLWFVAAGLIEMIPYVNIAPTYTITMAFVIYLVNNPSLAQVAQTIDIKKIKGRNLKKPATGRHLPTANKPLK